MVQMKNTNEKKKNSSPTCRELREDAKNMGVPRYSQMRKIELIKAINYRKANSKARFQSRKGMPTNYEAENPPKNKHLGHTKATFAKKKSVPISETEVQKRKAKHKEDSKMYLKKYNIRSVSDYLKYMMVEYDPESKESKYKAKELAGYVEKLLD